MLATAPLLLSFASLALGRPSVHSKPKVEQTPTSSNQQPHQNFHFPPPGRPPAVFRFSLGLVSQNADSLHASLLDASDPASTNYGKYLSKAEVEQLVAPTPEGMQAVTNWLNENNVTSTGQSPSGDMLQIQVPFDKANELLNANFTAYVHEPTNTTVWRTLSYSVPPDVAQHLSFIYPTTQFIPPATHKVAVQEIGQFPAAAKSGSKRADVPSACAQAITPGCLQAIYNIPATPASAAGNSLGVSGFGNEVANPADLQSFLSQARPDFPDGTFAVQAVDDGSDGGQGTTEASLDIQYTVGVATNVPTTFISVGQDTQDGDLDGFLDIINTLLAMDKPPLVLTTSFGFDETPFAQQAPEMAEKLCDAYAQLGARGTSVLFASGDGGVSGSQSNTACDGAAFIPTFPASCPYITAVGSTQGVSPETAADFSAGGFSNIFARPSYQSDAVNSYLQGLGNTNAGLFNTTGRGYPDVSTQGVQFIIEAAGKLQGVDGTSASSPTFASVVALLNDQLLNAGKSPLGFLNPLLYSKGVAALNDITSGSNPGCGTQGFPAAAGWDAVTGLGTPDFNKLAAVVVGSASQAQAVKTGKNATAPTSIKVGKPTASSHKRFLDLAPGATGFGDVFRFASADSSSVSVVALPTVAP
ncbi:hypothetical protein VTO73DRAFT_10996 [Trametes versicolor]